MADNEKEKVSHIEIQCDMENEIATSEQLLIDYADIGDTKSKTEKEIWKCVADGLKSKLKDALNENFEVYICSSITK
jgi:hypothetical protein